MLELEVDERETLPMIYKLSRKILALFLLISCCYTFTFPINFEPQAQAGSKQDVAPNQLLVKFKSGISDAQKDAYLSKLKAKRSDYLEFIKCDVVKVDDSRPLSSWRGIIKSSPLVQYAEYNHRLQLSQSSEDILKKKKSKKKKKKKNKKKKRTSSSNSAASVNPNADSLPNDPYFDRLWGLHNTGQTGGVAGTDIGAIEAWKNYSPSGYVIVAVIDTGIDYNHADLRPNIWINRGEDANRDGQITSKDVNNRDDDGNGLKDDFFGADWADGDSDPMDDHSHGTHVAGTIAASSNNRYGVAGVAGQGYVKVMALRFLNKQGSGYTSSAIKALGYAANKGALISNNSWGGGGYNAALYDAIRRYQSIGGLFVAAAGNSNKNNDTNSFYPACYKVNNVIAVASITDRNQRSSFSNYGAGTVHLAAPGSSILSTIPGNRFASYSGTSMAAPHVSGVAALVLSENPRMSPTQLKTVLLNSVQSSPSLRQVVATQGIVNADNALND